MNVGSLEIELYANVARLQKDMEEAKNSVGSAMSKINSLVGGAAKAFAALGIGLSVHFFVEMIKGSIDALDALNDLSKSTGITVDKLAGLKLAAKQSGSELEGTAQAINKLSVNMGKDGEKFAAIGVTAKDPLEAFKQLSDVFKSIEDPQTRAAFGAATLGKSWASAAPLLMEGSDSIGTMVARGMELSGVTQDMASQADALNDKFAELDASTQGIKLQLAGALLPLLNELVGTFSDTKKGASGVTDSFSPLTEIFRALIILGGNVAYVMKEVGKEIGGIASQLGALTDAQGALYSGKLSEAANGLKRAFGDGGIGDMMKADGEKARQEFDAWEKKIMEVGTVVAKASTAATETPKTPAGVKDFIRADSGGAAAKISDYTKLTAAINQKIAASKIEALLGDKATESQKLQIALNEGLTAGTIKMTGAQRGMYEANVRVLKSLEDASDVKKFLADQAKKEGELINARFAQSAQLSTAYASEKDQSNESLRTLRESNAALGLNAEQIANLTAVKLRKEAADAEELATQKELAGQYITGMAGAYAQQAADLRAVAAAKRESADTTVGGQNQAAVTDIYAEVAALNQKIATYGMVPTAITAAEIVRLEAARVTADDDVAEIARIDAKIIAMQALGVAQGKIAAIDKMGGNAQLMINQWRKVGDAIGKALSTGFGKGGVALGQMAVAYTDFQQKQIESAKKVADAQRTGDPAALAKAQLEAQKASAEAQIDLYGDIAGAAKNYFKEGSSGYKAMAAVEKAMHVIKMAMAIESMVMDTEQTGASVINSGIRAAADGVAAFAKTLSSMPYPYNLVAGASVIAALIAAGVSMSGGGGDGAQINGAEQNQKTQGRGTVTGDPEAQSESIKNSLEIMSKNSYPLLQYTNEMVDLLRSIDTSLGASTKNLFQTAGIFSGSAFGTHNEATSSFFGSDTTTDITDSGVQFKGSVGQLRNGGGTGQQYETVHKTDDGGWFSGDSAWDEQHFKDLGSRTMATFHAVFDNLGNLLVSAGVTLGYDGKTLTDALNKLPVDLQVSLRGLTGQDFQDALAAGLGTTFDKFAEDTFPELMQFNKVGEGMGETLIRLAHDAQQVNLAFQSIGVAFTTTGLAGIEATQDLINLAGGLDVLISQIDFFSQNFLTDAQRLAPIAANVTAEMDRLGLSGITTREQFANFVLTMDKTTPAGLALFEALMKVAPGFDAVASAAEKSIKKIMDGLERWRPKKTGLELYMEEAMAKIALKAATGFDSIDQLLGADFSGWSADNLKLADTFIVAHNANVDFNDGLANTVANATDAAQSLNAISWGDIVQTAQGEFDKLMAGITESASTLSGDDYSKEMAMTASYLQSQLVSLEAQRKAMITKQGGMSYGNTDQLIGQEMWLARQKIAELTSDLTQYTLLEAQYKGHGKELLDLKHWHDEQAKLMYGNGAALVLLEQSYEKKRIDIINGTLTNGLNQTADALAKWLDGIQAWLNSNLLDTSLSPLTAQQRFAEAERQKNVDLIAAQAGDLDARARLTKDYDAYEKEALAMYGKASLEYRAIFDLSREELTALLAMYGTTAQVLTTTPVAAGSVSQDAAVSAKQQTDDLISHIMNLETKLDAMTSEQKRTTAATEKAAGTISNSVDSGATRTVRQLETIGSKGLISNGK